MGCYLVGLDNHFYLTFELLVPNVIHSVFTPAEWVSRWAAIWLALVLVSYDLVRSVIMPFW